MLIGHDVSICHIQISIETDRLHWPGVSPAPACAGLLVEQPNPGLVVQRTGSYPEEVARDVGQRRRALRDFFRVGSVERRRGASGLWATDRWLDLPAPPTARCRGVERAGVVGWEVQRGRSRARSRRFSRTLQRTACTERRKYRPRPRPRPDFAAVGGQRAALRHEVSATSGPWRRGNGRWTRRPEWHAGQRSEGSSNGATGAGVDSGIGALSCRRQAASFVDRFRLASSP